MAELPYSGLYGRMDSFTGGGVKSDPKAPWGAAIAAGMRRQSIFAQGGKTSSVVQPGPRFSTLSELDEYLRYEEEGDGRFNPFEIEGYFAGYEQFAERFFSVKTPEQGEMVKSRIRQERIDQELLGHAGFRGFVGETLGAIANPASVIPLAAGAKITRIGRMWLTSKRIAPAIAAEEVILQNTQKTRTGTETFFNIAATTFFAAILSSFMKGRGRTPRDPDIDNSMKESLNDFFGDIREAELASARVVPDPTSNTRVSETATFFDEAKKHFTDVKERVQDAVQEAQERGASKKELDEIFDLEDEARALRIRAEEMYDEAKVNQKTAQEEAWHAATPEERVELEKRFGWIRLEDIGLGPEEFKQRQAREVAEKEGVPSGQKIVHLDPIDETVADAARPVAANQEARTTETILRRQAEESERQKVASEKRIAKLDPRLTAQEEALHEIKVADLASLSKDDLLRTADIEYRRIQIRLEEMDTLTGELYERLELELESEVYAHIKDGKSVKAARKIMADELEEAAEDAERLREYFVDPEDIGLEAEPAPRAAVEPVRAEDVLVEEGKVIPFPDVPVPPRGVGAAPVDTAESVSARQARDREGLMPAAGLEKMPDNLLKRLLNSPVTYARELIQQMVENPMYLKKHGMGIASEVSVESAARRFQWPLVEALQIIDNLYAKHRGVVGKVGYMGHAKMDVEQLVRGKETAHLSRQEFNEEIARALRNGDKHVEPHVQEAAQWIREHVFNPMHKAAQEAQIWTRHLYEEIEQLQLRAEQMDSPNIRNSIMRQIRAIQDLIKQIDEQGPTPSMTESYFPRIFRHDKIIDDMDGFENLLYGVFRKNGVPEGKLKETVRETVEEVLREKPYIAVDEDTVGLARALRRRTLEMDDNLLEPYLESDVGGVLRHYTRTTGMDIALSERFGHHSMKDQIKALEVDYFALMEAMPTNKAKADVRKRMNRDLNDVRVARDRLRGTYGLPDDPYRRLSRGYRVVKELNYMTMLGGVVISSIPDTARLMMEDGITRAFQHAFVPWAKQLDQLKLTKREGQMAGTMADMALGVRALAFADLGDVFGRKSGLERALQGGSGVFSMVNLFNPWNQMMKEMAGGIVTSRIIRASQDYGTGSLRGIPIADVSGPGTIKVFRGSGGGGKVVMARATSFGKGEYFAATKKTAGHFGTEVEETTIHLDNPFIIKNDAELLEAMRSRNIDADTLDKAQKAYTAHIQEVDALGKATKKGKPIEELWTLPGLSIQKTIAPMMKKMEELGRAYRRVKADTMEELAAAVRKEGHDGAVFAFGQPDFHQTTKGLLTPGKQIRETMSDLKHRSNAMILGEHFNHDQVVTFGKTKRPTVSKIKKGDAAKLARTAIDKPMAERIARQFRLHGKIEQDVYMPNTEMWGTGPHADLEAARHFRAALAQDVERIIVTPGAGDRANWMSTELGSVIAQFKSFSVAAGQRVLIPALQEKDAAALHGALMLIGMGMLVDQIKHMQYGDTRERSLKERIAEGFDRSGLGSYFMDINRIIEKLSDNRLGAMAALGIAPPYRSNFRNKIGSVLGPTAGQMARTAGILTDIGTGDYDYHTAGALRRMLPGQNIFYFDPLFDAVEKGMSF